MKTPRLRAFILVWVFATLPSVALAHNPGGPSGVAWLVSFTIATAVGYTLIRVGWKLGHRLTSHQSRRTRLIVSSAAVIMAILISVFVFLTMAGVAMVHYL